MDADKQHAHELLDQLGPSQLAAVTRLLEVMVDPLGHSIAQAQVEEEQITPEIATALDRTCASIERGEGIPHEEVLRAFGFAPRR
jgi:ethanolamine utilization microcompartment shell protein EutL